MMYARQLLSFQQDIITQLLSTTYTCLGWQEEEWILIGRLLHPNLIDASASFNKWLIALLLIAVSSIRSAAKLLVEQEL